MRTSKLVGCLGALALAVASAAPRGSHLVTLYEPSVINGMELKPGEYRLEVNGNKATLKGAKQSVEASVKVEEEPAKTSSTTVRYNTVEGKYKVEAIRLGGTKTKLVFGESGGAGTSSGLASGR